jgi:single-strand DNA-binding protein
MPNLNKVMLIGNLTRDPEVKYTPKGTAVADIGLAVNRVYSSDQGEKREETTFVDVELWGRQAEVAEEYLKKGRPVYIEGRLKLDTWDDRQTGEKRSKLRVVGETLQLLGGRPESGSERDEREAPSQCRGGYRQDPPPRQQQRSSRPPRDPDLDRDDDDDVPF